MKVTPILLTICLASVTLTGGCAFTNRDNMRTLNWVEDDLMPEKGTTARAMSYPVMVPLGLCSMAADIIVVHPICSIDDAYYDTDDACWSRFDWETGYVTECAQLPFRVVFTPVVFVVDWGFRCFFDIGPNSRAPQPKARKVRPGDEGEPVVERPQRMGYVGQLLQDVVVIVDGASVFTDHGRPKWLSRGQKELGSRIIDALRTDCWTIPSGRLAEASYEPDDPLCWITLRGRKGVMVFWVDEHGFGEVRAGRFSSPKLARILTELIDPETFDAGADVERWRKALRAAAVGGDTPNE